MSLDLFKDVWDAESKSIAVDALIHTISSMFSSMAEPFIFYGSLLGFARGGKIIKWDGDIDLCVDENFGKFTAKSILRRRGYSIYPDDKHGESPYYFRVLSPKGMETQSDFAWPWIDVYYYRLVDGGFRFLSNDGSVFYRCPHDEIFPLRLEKFEGLDVLVPSNPTIHLDRIYPDWQKTAESSIVDHRRACINAPKVRVPIEEVL